MGLTEHERLRTPRFREYSAVLNKVWALNASTLARLQNEAAEDTLRQYEASAFASATSEAGNFRSTSEAGPSSMRSSTSEGKSELM
jgi:hypothetical protein